MTAQQNPCRKKAAAATGTHIQMDIRTKRTENRGTFIHMMEQQNILTRMPAGMFITAMYIPKRRCAL